MADRHLIASGSRTNAAIFDGGTFPAAVDTLRTNGFTLTVDADFTVAEITNDIAGGATTAGGQVVLNGGVVLNADLMVRAALSTGGRFVSTNYGNATSTINGNGFHLLTGLNSTVLEVTGQPDGVLILNGDWRHEGTSVGNAGLRAINLIGNGQGFRVVCNGEVSGSYTTAAGMQSNMHGIYCNSGYIIDFNGVVTGRNANSTGVNKTSKGCLLTGSNNVVNVNGLALGGLVTVSDPLSQAIDAGNSTNVVNLFGNAVATLTNRAIVGGTVVFQSGANIIDHPENVAVSGIRERLVPFASVVREMVDVNGIDTVNMYTASLLTGYPPQADVRSGEVFGPVGEFTGTLSPVNVDIQQLASDLLTELNASNLPIAEGLRDGMGASAAAIAAVGSIQAIP